MNSWKKREVSSILLVAPVVILYLIFFIIPVAKGIVYSFTDWNGIGKDYDFVGLQNYLQLLQDQRFLSDFLFSLKYAAFLVFIVIGISLILAHLLNVRVKGRGAFRALYFFPAVVSMLTAGLIFNEIYYRITPLIGNALNISWLMESPLANSETAIWGILLVNIWQGLPIPTLLLMAGIQSVPQELYEVAKLDGAGKWRQFVSITLPYLKSMLTVVFVLVLKDGLMVFDYIVALTNGGPGGATESISFLIYNHGFKEIKFSYALTESIIVCIIMCFISFCKFLPQIGGVYKNRKSKG